MEEFISTPEKLTEAQILSEKILTEIELGTSSLSSISLMASRLARIVGHFDYVKIFSYEASGYPTAPTGVDTITWELLTLAKRINQTKDGDKINESASLESLEQVQIELDSAKDNINVSQDANISIASANPKQYVQAPLGNKFEREKLRNIISAKSKFLAKRRAFIYDYASTVFYEIKYSSISNDIFSRIRGRVDEKIGALVPDAIQKFSAVYENLKSENNENWSNAVHSCRRILQDLADQIYPSREDKILTHGKTIKLGSDNYINRIMAFVDENSNSDRFSEIVGSHLRYMGERLDSIFKAAQKGSHDTITSQDEADRYVVYTYLIVGDILQLHSLLENKEANTTPPPQI